MPAFTNINAITNPNCYKLAFLYDAASAVNATFVNCGDLTPMSINSTTVGAPSSVFWLATGLPSSVVLTSGILSAGPAVGGYGQRYVPYAAVVTTVAALTSLPDGNYQG